MEILNDIRLKKYKNLLFLFYSWLGATFGIIILGICFFYFFQFNILTIENVIFHLSLLLALGLVWFLAEIVCK